MKVEVRFTTPNGVKWSHRAVRGAALRPEVAAIYRAANMSGTRVEVITKGG